MAGYDHMKSQSIQGRTTITLNPDASVFPINFKFHGIGNHDDIEFDIAPTPFGGVTNIAGEYAGAVTANFYGGKSEIAGAFYLEKHDSRAVQTEDITGGFAAERTR